MVVPIPARPPTFLVTEEGSEEWDIMWARLREKHEPAGWRYLGTWSTGVQWIHHFKNESEVVRVVASDGWAPEEGICRQDTTDSTEEN